MTTDLTIIVCSDGSIKLQKPNGEVSTLQVLIPETVRQLENVSPYRDWRQMFSYRKDED